MKRSHQDISIVPKVEPKFDMGDEEGGEAESNDVTQCNPVKSEDAGCESRKDDIPKLVADAIWSKVLREVEKNENLGKPQHHTDVYLENTFLGLQWYKKGTHSQETPSLQDTERNARGDQMVGASVIGDGDSDQFNMSDLLNGGAFSQLMEELRVEAQVPTQNMSVEEPRHTGDIICERPKEMCKENLEKKGDGWSIVSRQVGNGGRRMYAITELDHMYEAYVKLPERERTMNELIADDVPCKLYLDVDMKNVPGFKDGEVKVETTPVDYVDVGQTEGTQWGIQGSNRQVDPKMTYKRRQNAAKWKLEWTYFKHAVNKLSEDLCKKLIVTYFSDLVLDHDELKPISWTILDASNEKKFSAHVIFNIFHNSVFFASKSDVGSFVERHVLEELETIEKERSLQEVYNGVHRFKRPKYEGAEATTLVTMNTTTKHNPNGVYEEVLKSTDLSIYSGEREFRMWESVKKGEENRPLVLLSRHSVDISADMLRDVRSGKQRLTLQRSNQVYLKLEEDLWSTKGGVILKKVRRSVVSFGTAACHVVDGDQSAEDPESSNEDGDAFFDMPGDANRHKRRLAEISFGPDREYFNRIPSFDVYLDTLVSHLDYSTASAYTMLKYSDVVKEKVKDLSNLTKLREEVFKEWMYKNPGLVYKTSLDAKSGKSGGRRKRIKNVEAPEQMAGLELEHESLDELDELDGDVIWNAIMKEIEVKSGLCLLNGKDGLKMKKIKEYMVGGEESIELNQHRVSFSTNVHYCEIKHEMFTKGCADSSEHHSNHIYYVVDLNNRCFWQKCHNVGCKRYYARKKIRDLEEKLKRTLDYDAEKKFKEDRQRLLTTYEHQCKGKVIPLSKSLWDIIDDFVQLTQKCKQVQLEALKVVNE